MRPPRAVAGRLDRYHRDLMTPTLSGPNGHDSSGLAAARPHHLPGSRPAAAQERAHQPCAVLSGKMSGALPLRAERHGAFARLGPVRSGLLYTFFE